MLGLDAVLVALGEELRELEKVFLVVLRLVLVVDGSRLVLRRWVLDHCLVRDGRVVGVGLCVPVLDGLANHYLGRQWRQGVSSPVVLVVDLLQVMLDVKF